MDECTACITAGFSTCGICIVTALNSWCGLRNPSYNASAGCCGSCFDKSFDEDAFDTKNGAGIASKTDEQPAATTNMSIPEAKADAPAEKTVNASEPKPDIADAKPQATA